MSGFSLCALGTVRGVTATAGADSVSNLLTRDPKEAWLGTIGANVITLDFGVARAWDTVFLGATTAARGATWGLRYGADATASTVLFAGRPIVEPRVLPGFEAPRSVHLFTRLDARVTSRYVRIDIDSGAAQLAAGGLVIGASFTPTWPHELGGGRGVVDTGGRERLSGGGFGVSEGVRKRLVQWTFGDLSDEEVDTLYTFVEALGETQPLIAAQQPWDGAGLQERLTYGVFDRLEVYDRRDTAKTRWAFKMEEWR